MKKFIKTKDQETINKLIKCGFQVVSYDDSGTYTFFNNGKMTFEADANKVAYTNILTV